MGFTATAPAAKKASTAVTLNDMIGSEGEEGAAKEGRSWVKEGRKEESYSTPSVR